jgi:hypothetical protein
MPNGATKIQIYLVLDTAAGTRKGRDAGRLLVMVSADIREAAEEASRDPAYMLFASKGEVEFERVSVCPCCQKPLEGCEDAARVG